MGFIVFLLSPFRLVFLPTTLNSLPPGVMLLNRSTAPRDSATDIGKISQKITLEREGPNRSVVKIYNYSATTKHYRIVLKKHLYRVSYGNRYFTYNFIYSVQNW